MTAATATTPTQKFRLPGRPMKLGRYVTNEKAPGGYGYNAGACGNCHAKNIMTHEEAVEFSKQFVRERKSLSVRFLERLVKARAI